MGQVERMEEEKRSRKSRAAQKARGKYDNVSLRDSDSGDASWAEVDPAMLLDAVISVTNDGDAIMFCRSRDGGSLGLLVYSGGKVAVKEYSADKDEVETLLGSVIDATKP